MDLGGVYVSNSALPGGDLGFAASSCNVIQAKRRFNDFIRAFTEEKSLSYLYRDQLKTNCTMKKYFLVVDLAHLSTFDKALAEDLTNNPSTFVPIFEEAATKAAKDILRISEGVAISNPPRNDTIFVEKQQTNQQQAQSAHDKIQPIQLILRWHANTPMTLRDLQSNQVSRLVKVCGIVISVSQVRLKASHVTLQCRACRHFLPNLPVRPGFDGFALPRKCLGSAAAGGAGVAGQSGVGQSRAGCPLDPYFIVGDKSRCFNFQTLKLQEPPELVPHGEVPRHTSVYVSSALCDLVAPGHRVSVTGIYSVRGGGVSAAGGGGGKSSSAANENGTRKPYLRALGIELIPLSSSSSSAMTTDDDSQSVTQITTQPSEFDVDEHDAMMSLLGGLGNNGQQQQLQRHQFSQSEVENFQALASRSDIYELVVRSVAPSIMDCDDMKRAIACLLFGGSRKRLPDGLWRRGDLNVLLLGDPGTAKSQLLKFVERAAPVAVYTSGKGSSAAGLTASVIRDTGGGGGGAAAGNAGGGGGGFRLEGGAMVLADGGVVCIDEFDKMREEDRVAIHEAMEQQTISLAKAGITATLNSRCSVLAAANSVLGKWDDSLGGAANIEFMPTILSRFDMIFVVRDTHEEERDWRMAQHVMRIHTQHHDKQSEQQLLGGDSANDHQQQQLTIHTLKRFVAYCRQTCGPRLSQSAAALLQEQYVKMRAGANQSAAAGKSAGATVPITIRQLEAIVRISEALAKMRLAAFATESDVHEAVRLFQVSTLRAAAAGSLEGVEGFVSGEEVARMARLERLIRKRFVIGAQINAATLQNELVKQAGFSENSVRNLMSAMMRRGEILARMQGRLFIRVK